MVLPRKGSPLSLAYTKVTGQGKGPPVTLLPPSDIPRNPSLAANGKLLVYTSNLRNGRDSDIYVYEDVTG